MPGDVLYAIRASFIPNVNFKFHSNASEFKAQSPHYIAYELFKGLSEKPP